MITAQEVLQKYWGYSSFRAGQVETVGAVLGKRDTLSLLPTGAGKSVCFQVPAVVFGGLTIVISPLISLMQDQVASLIGRGIDSFAFSGEIDWKIESFLRSRIQSSTCFILYLAPERIGTVRLNRVLADMKVSLIVVDEAHCISSWGRDFRPAYRKIVLLQRQFPAPLCALTATATNRVRRDIIKNLRLSQPIIIQRSFDRPNIRFRLIKAIDAREHVLSLLASEDGGNTGGARLADVRQGAHGTRTNATRKNASGCVAIVYDSSREGVEVWAEKLRRAGVSAGCYHGGMNTRERARSQRRWMQKKVRVMVATNAFGMGIDRPDVRLVIHVGLPDSIESYFQEAGRAGRDGRPAQAIIIDTPEAREGRLSLTLKGKRGERRRGLRLLKPLLRHLDRPLCRRWGMLGYFGEGYRAQQDNCQNCDVCLSDQV